MPVWPFSPEHLLRTIRSDPQADISLPLARAKYHLLSAQDVWAAAQETITDGAELVGFLLERLTVPGSDEVLSSVFEQLTEILSKAGDEESYMTILPNASLIKSESVKKFERREHKEEVLEKFGNSNLRAWIGYLNWELSQPPGDDMVQGVCERALQALYPDETAMEQIAVTYYFWLKSIHSSEEDLVREGPMDLIQRCAELCPRSNLLLRLYLGELHTADQNDRIESIYNDKLKIKDEQHIPEVANFLAAMQRRSGKTQDISRARKILGYSCWALELEYVIALENSGFLDKARKEWGKMMTKMGSSYEFWIEYGQFESRHSKENARAVYKSACDASAKMDWPEMVFQAWQRFEHRYGSFNDQLNMESCVWKAACKVKEIREKAAYQSQIASSGLTQAEHTPADVTSSVVTEAVPSTSKIDEDSEVSRKRTNAEELSKESDNKRQRMNDASHLSTSTTRPKRDREHTTIIVANLPPDTAESTLRGLFKDCGPISELLIKVMPRSGRVVATIEFQAQDSVPAALTKDKKRIAVSESVSPDEYLEISVGMGEASTLFVKNFPKGTDDSSMRAIFAPYGEVFDIRWPTKSKRNLHNHDVRFCYVQMSSSDHARKAASSLNGSLHGGEQLPLGVAISNPSVKAVRSDAGKLQREIVVGGLARRITEDELKDLFKVHGNILEVRLVKHEDGTCKGSAFIDFSSAEEATAALALNNHTLRSRNISVTLPTQRSAVNTADLKDRSVRISPLKLDTSEPLFQQAVEKIFPVRSKAVVSVEIRPRGPIAEAFVVCDSSKNAGELCLKGIIWEGVKLVSDMITTPRQRNIHALLPSSNGQATEGPKPATKVTSFVPSSARGGRRGGLGVQRRAVVAVEAPKPDANGLSASKSGKDIDQDFFRSLIK